MMLEKIPTPAIIINLPAVKQNIQRMAEYTRQHNLQLRPHIKTHKSKRMAQLQLQAGAVGLTTAKAGEAEVMAQESNDILLGYPVVDNHRAQSIGVLAQRVNLKTALDSKQSVDVVNQAATHSQSSIGVLVDMDVGYHRTGVQSPQAALELAQYIESQSHVKLEGIFCYFGHISPVLPDKQQPLLESVSLQLKETIELWKKHGLEAKTVSGGSTPSALQSHFVPELTEIRPGTYIYNDRNSVSCQCSRLEDCAAKILCTVVSTAVPGKVILDAGSKTLTSDMLVHNSATAGHGYIVQYPTAKITRLTEEHGEVDISNCDTIPKLGERVQVIPNHVCPCINLQNSVWLQHEDGSLEEMPIDARGLLT